MPENSSPGAFGGYSGRSKDNNGNNSGIGSVDAAQSASKDAAASRSGGFGGVSSVGSVDAAQDFGKSSASTGGGFSSAASNPGTNPGIGSIDAAQSYGQNASFSNTQGPAGPGVGSIDAAQTQAQNNAAGFGPDQTGTSTAGATAFDDVDPGVTDAVRDGFMSNTDIDQSVRDAIDFAAREFDVPFDALAGTISLESSFNPNAKNPNSSATGLAQHIDSTWSETTSRYGAKYGITKNTSRRDPAASALMGAALMAENKKALEKANIPVDKASLYTAHFAGLAGAKKAFSADPNAPASSVFSRAAVKANGFLGKQTVGQTIQGFRDKMDKAIAGFSRPQFTALPDDVAVPTSRPEEQSYAPTTALSDVRSESTVPTTPTTTTKTATERAISYLQPPEEDPFAPTPVKTTTFTVPAERNYAPRTGLANVHPPETEPVNPVDVPGSAFSNEFDTTPPERTTGQKVAGGLIDAAVGFVPGLGLANTIAGVVPGIPSLGELATSRAGGGQAGPTTEPFGPNDPGNPPESEAEENTVVARARQYLEPPEPPQTNRYLTPLQKWGPGVRV